jgi:bifunctional UDP-N-acetylglucosamine pyrophosphorylase/glucosamine-1-phosphate N-acetyltransferase
MIKPMSVHVVILAAGKGTRMNSELPKVLQPLGGKPMLEHVMNTAATLENAQFHIVVGHGCEQVKQHFQQRAEVNWVLQEQQLGTGHAVSQAMPGISAEQGPGVVLVLCGDVPLISTASLEQLIQNADADTLAILTLVTNNPTGLGRIVRDTEDHVIGIVEEKDATPEQRKIGEINSGIMALPADRLRKWLQRLGNNNKQGEYYLTDVISMAVNDGCHIFTKAIDDEWEVMGINDKAQLASLERHYQQLKADELMQQGTTLLDPQRIDIRGDLKCGRDVTIDVNVVFEGEVTIGNNVTIESNVKISNSSIGDNSVILANSVIENADIADQCSIGPFARLRPGSVLKSRSKVGNFVETKNSTLGEGSKANHFAYIGDADIGNDVNIGAGTIFCNYDGARKHRCVIGSNVFIGSNSTLVAPVSISDGAFVAAGSTINADVSENELAIGRGRQRNITGWQRPTKS